MSAHIFSSGDFARNVAAAKRVAVNGPVFITHQGQPAFVLLTIDAHHHLVRNNEPSLLDVMDACTTPTLRGQRASLACLRGRASYNPKQKRTSPRQTYSQTVHPVSTTTQETPS